MIVTLTNHLALLIDFYQRFCERANMQQCTAYGNMLYNYASDVTLLPRTNTHSYTEDFILL